MFNMLPEAVGSVAVFGCLCTQPALHVIANPGHDFISKLRVEKSKRRPVPALIRDAISRRVNVCQPFK